MSVAKAFATADPNRHDLGMGAGLRISPAWKSAIFRGVFFTAWMSVWDRHDYHDSWPRILIENAVIGVGYALVMYSATRKNYQARELLLSGLDDQQRRDVLRAARTGKPPADRTLRAVAAALVKHRLAEYVRNRTLNLVVFTGAAVLAAVVAISSGGWYWAAVPLFGYGLISVIRYPGKQRRNLAALSPPPSPAPPAKVRQ